MTDIAMGLDAEAGGFILLFLDLAYDEAVREARMRSRESRRRRHSRRGEARAPEGDDKYSGFMGLMPILCSAGTGADMMKRIVVPMVGGLVTSFALELLVCPAIYILWKGRGLNHSLKSAWLGGSDLKNGRAGKKRSGTASTWR